MFKKNDRGDMKLCNLKKHPFLVAIFVFQITFILLMLIKSCIFPISVIPIGMKNFVADDEYAYKDKGILYFLNDGSINADNKTTVQTKNLGITIPSGAYSFDIEYSSSVDDIETSEYNTTVNAKSQYKIYFDEIRLNTQKKTMSGRLYIPLFISCDDLGINISYNGNGTANISNITLTELPEYRFVRLMGIALLFLMLDFAIALFFTSIEIPVKREHAILLLIIAMSSLPFLATKLYSGHDLRWHLLRIASVAQELSNGQFPVRMETSINNGYSYPWSIYYCDIFLYPAALLYLMKAPLRICYQLYAISVNVFTTLFTYKAIGKITKNNSFKLLGTALYVLCIYRLVNINVRVAVGEYTAMAFLPLVASGMYLIYTKERPQFKDWIYLTVGMSGIIMSHIVSCEMVVINLILLCIILIKKTLKKEVFLSLVKAATLCVGITSWFAVPFLDYYLHHETIIKKEKFVILENRAVEAIELLGQFAPGKDRGHYIAIGMSLVIGVGLILYCLAKYKKSKEINTLRVIGGLAFLNVFFVNKFFPWEGIQRHLQLGGLGYKMGNVQFVWRFLSIASVLLTFAAIIALNMINEKQAKVARAICLSLICSIFVSVGFFYYAYTDGGGTSEYNTMQTADASDNLYLLSGTNNKNQNFALPKVLSGNAQLGEYSKEGSCYKLYVENDSNKASFVSLPIYNYRYFNIYDKAGDRIDKTKTDNNCIEAGIPAQYAGDIIVKFEPPYTWRVAELVSILTIAGTSWYIFRKFGKFGKLSKF